MSRSLRRRTIRLTRRWPDVENRLCAERARDEVEEILLLGLVPADQMPLSDQLRMLFGDEWIDVLRRKRLRDLRRTDFGPRRPT
jgi:hypothetical protein